MASTGLTGKRFIGKIVKGFDPENRGRYYVHVPELMPHMPETKGIICTNSIHPTRQANGASGSYGSYMPLHEGTTVEVSCQTDDISSARILSIVSDEKPDSDMSPGKLMCVEPSGKIIQAVVRGLPDNPFDPNPVLSTVENLINSGTEMGLKLLGPVLGLINALGNFVNGLKRMFAGVISSIPGADLLPLDKVAGLIPDIPTIGMRSRLSIGGMDLLPSVPNFESLAKDFNIMESISSVSLSVFDIKQVDGMWDGIKDFSESFFKDKVQTVSGVFESAKNKLANVVDSQDYPDVLNEVRADKIKQLMSPLSTTAENGVSVQFDLPSFDDLSEFQKKAIDYSLGALNKAKFINEMATQFYKTGSLDLSSIMTTDGLEGYNPVKTINICIPGEFPYYDYGKGTKKQNNKERDQQYTVMKTPANSGMYVNEDTTEDPYSLNIVYAGKQSAVRMDPDGIRISTNQNYRQRIEVNREIETDGESYITVKGGDYAIYVENGKVELWSKDSVNIYSEEGDLNLTAKKNINLFSLEGNIVSRAENGNIYANAKETVNIQAETKEIMMNAIESSILTSSKYSSMSMSEGGVSLNSSEKGIYIDGKTVDINSGKSETINLTCDTGEAILPKFAGKPIAKI